MEDVVVDGFVGLKAGGAGGRSGFANSVEVFG